MRTSILLAFAIVTPVAACGEAQAAPGAGSLQDNLRKLEQRAESSKPKTASRPKPAPRIVTAHRPVRRVRAQRDAPRRVTMARASSSAITERVKSMRQAASPGSASGSPMQYVPSRVGVKSRAGDVQVSAAAPGRPVHVYFKQRLVSAGGNGTARVPDIEPGKYPVMLWSPGSGSRRTFWVTVKRGATACLTVNM